MAFQTSLKSVLHDTGLKQYVICERTGLTQWRLSRIINGVVEATADEKKALARYLKKPVSYLFPADEAVAS